MSRWPKDMDLAVREASGVHTDAVSTPDTPTQPEVQTVIPYRALLAVFLMMIGVSLTVTACWSLGGWKIGILSLGVLTLTFGFIIAISE